MKQVQYRPSKIAEEILETLLLRAVNFGALVDYEEQFHRIVKRSGRFRAHLWYTCQIFLLFPSFIYNSIYWSFVMLKNYFLVAFRNLKKQKVYSLINISGLAVGMAGFALFGMSSAIKLNADRFHKNGDRIYTVVQVLSSENKEEEHIGFTPGPFLPTLRNEFPEIEDAVRVYPAGKMTIRRKNESFYENNILFVDSNFLTFFTFAMVDGNPETALSNPFSIVLSEAAAFKYFGNANPIGQVLTLNNKVNVTVTGVTQNIKKTSTIRFEFLVSLETARSLFQGLEDWSVNRHAGFVLLPKGFDRASFEEKLSAFTEKVNPHSRESLQRAYLFPLLDLRLKGLDIRSFVNSSHPIAVYIILFFGVLLLAIVSINFVNLSIARHLYRTKEVGVRKVVGARRFQLITQFLGESLFLSFLALPIAIVLYELIHPILAATVGSTGPIPSMTNNVTNSIYNYPFLLKYLITAALLTGLFSGLYPAFFMSAFQPVQILKGHFKKTRKTGRGRKIMIVFQFSLSIILIVVAGILKTQTKQLVKADLGYSRERIATVQVTGQQRSDIEILKTEIARHPDIKHVTASAQLPLLWSSNRPVRSLDMSEDEAITLDAYGIDYDFIETLEMELKEGRSFSRHYGDDKSLILNEAAVKKFQWDNPIGQQLKVGEGTGTIVGVVHDFLFDDIGFEMPPAILYLEQDDLNYVLIKYAASSNSNSIEAMLKEKWQKLMPDVPFQWSTLEDYFYFGFGLMDKIAGFFNAMGLVAVFFCCLGLLGMASYMVEQRTKEIGIRKILGASFHSVVWNLIKEFMVLVAIANVIAFPLLYFGWRRVLQTGILYMTGISAGNYIFAAFVSLFMAVLAVASQTLKTVRANPVDSLRYE